MWVSWKDAGVIWLPCHAVDKEERTDGEIEKTKRETIKAYV